MSAAARSLSTDKKMDVLLAEYQWAAGLLPFYRQVEMTALGASALVLSAVASVVAVLEGGERPDRAAEATLLAAAAWGPTVLLLLELMALTRIQRAALYIRHYIAEPARQLAGDDDLLRWEDVSAERLFIQDGTVSPRLRRAVEVLVSSAPVVLAIGSMTLALSVSAAVMHPHGPAAAPLIIGYSAALASLGLCAYGIRFTWLHERHSHT